MVSLTKPDASNIPRVNVTKKWLREQRKPASRDWNVATEDQRWVRRVVRLRAKKSSFVSSLN